MNIQVENDRFTVEKKEAFVELKSGQVLIEMMDSFLNIDNEKFPSLKIQLEKIENVLSTYSSRLLAALDRQNILLFEDN
jgi:hypothetical protein